MYIKNNIKYSQKFIDNCIKNLPIQDVKIEDIKIEIPFYWEVKSLSNFIYHLEKIMKIDLDKTLPILLDKNFILIDGNHRLAKAILEQRKIIKTKILDFDLIERSGVKI